jgi:RNA polymerase sigma-70 factor (ECF subfamily)
MDLEQPSVDPGQETDETRLVLGLVTRVQRGDTEALAALYDIYAGRVHAILLRAVEPGLAEELLQDVFVALWQKAQLFDPTRGSFKAWFFTLVRHRLYDALPRYQKVRNENPLSSPTIADQVSIIPDARPGPEDEILKLFRDTEIRAALGGLPDEQREVILHTFFGGLTQRELAERMKLPLSTIKGRSRLALQRLRQLLSEGEYRQA